MLTLGQLRSISLSLRTTPSASDLWLFLEHIDYSLGDGLFAEQIRGAGFEGGGVKTY